MNFEERVVFCISYVYIKKELDLFTMHPFESAKKMGAGCSDENGG